MAKKNPTIEDVLQRFDRLESKLQPLLQNTQADDGYLPLNELPFPASTARKYIYAKLLPAFRVGKRLFIRKSDLAAFMQNRPRKGRKPNDTANDKNGMEQERKTTIGNRLAGVNV